MKYRVRGKGELVHECGCPHCTYIYESVEMIDEVVEADTPEDAERAILLQEASACLLGVFSWFDPGPVITAI